MDEIKKYYHVLIAAIAFAGLVVMSYLTYIHYSGVTSFCDIAAGISCDVVTTSIYSEIFGIPMSVLGILYFAAAFLISLISPTSRSFRFLFLATSFVLIPSLYLTLTEIFFIHSFCILCETSKILMVFILGISYSAIKAESSGFLRVLLPLLIAGVVISAIIYFVQVGGI